MVLIYLGVSAVLIAAIERAPQLRFAALSFFRPLFASDLVYLGTGFLAGTSVSLAYILAASAALGAFGAPRLESLDLPLWTNIPLALVALDLGNYSAHWLLHRFDPLWEVHKVHHSIRALDWLATFRSHLLEQTLRRLLAPIGLILLGVPVAAVATAGAIFNGWAILNHSNLAIDLRFLEPVFVTPRLHRSHHAAATTHYNLGTVFSIWDRLRGTLIAQDLTKSTLLGVPGEVESYPQGWGRQLLEPLWRIFPGMRGGVLAHESSRR